MAFTRSTVTTNIIRALADQPTETATQLKTKFDEYAENDKAYTNSTLLVELEKTTAGSSGAENIGSAAISGVTGTTVRAQISDVKTQLDARNSENVKLTGDQTIAGVKTFSSSPIVPTPTSMTQAANKNYIDTVASGFVIGTLPQVVEKTVSAITYYVNGTTGSNSNDGLTAGTPFLTIQYAINKIPKYLAHDCVINVVAGTYPENLNVYGFVGEGTLTINGDTALSTSFTVQNFELSSCSNSNVIIKGFNANTTTAAGFTVFSCSYVTLNFCQSVGIDGTNQGILAFSSNVYVSNCEFSNKAHGIYATYMSNVSIADTTGTGNTNGLRCYRGSTISKYSTGNTITGTTPEVTLGGVIVPSDSGAAILQNPTGTALPATTGTISVTMDSKIKTITPTGSCTFNATVGNKGDICTFRVFTSGTSSYNLTFGTNFKTTAVLATGTVTSKTFTVTFVYDGTNWCEIGRTVAM